MEPLGYWIYLKNGNLFQEYPDVEAPFLGVKESGRKFREKEIVELMAYGKLELAIIISYPLTPEEIEYRKKRAIEKFNFAHENGFTDYFFFAIIYKDGVTAENIKETNHEYDYNHGLNIFPLSYPVSSEQKKCWRICMLPENLQQLPY